MADNERAITAVCRVCGKVFSVAPTARYIPNRCPECWRAEWKAYVEEHYGKRTVNRAR